MTAVLALIFLFKSCEQLRYFKRTVVGWKWHSTSGLYISKGKAVISIVNAMISVVSFGVINIRKNSRCGKKIGPLACPSFLGFLCADCGLKYFMLKMAAKVDPVERLKEEHKAWKCFHPKDFIANPLKREDGTINWLVWKCAIPGPAKTPWEGGLFPLRLEFPQDYPFSPPKCIFTPSILHPNVFPSGTVCLSLIDKNKDWKPQVTMKQVLQGIQLLLQDPNFLEPAQAEAFMIHSQSSLDYENKVKAFAKQMDPATSTVLRDINTVST